MYTISKFILRTFISSIFLIIAACLIDGSIDVFKQGDLFLSIVLFIFTIFSIAASGVIFVELKKIL